MTKRLVFCEGIDDLNALRAIAQHLRWATAGSGLGQDRKATLHAGVDVKIEITVPSKSRGATGEGKSALPASLADELHNLRPQIDPEDEARVSLVSVVFDPDDKAAGAFHDDLVRAIGDRAPGWTLTATDLPGVWRAAREPGEQLEIRAVHWRAPGAVLDGLPDHANLERLLCAVLAKAYADDKDHVARWLAEIDAARRRAGRKPASWKGAIHIWLAAVYDKVDEVNAASRVLHQQDECKPHVRPVLDDVGLLTDLAPLLGGETS